MTTHQPELNLKISDKLSIVVGTAVQQVQRFFGLSQQRKDMSPLVLLKGIGTDVASMSDLLQPLLKALNVNAVLSNTNQHPRFKHKPALLCSCMLL